MLVDMREGERHAVTDMLPIGHRDRVLTWAAILPQALRPLDSTRRVLGGVPHCLRRWVESAAQGIPCQPRGMRRSPYVAVGEKAEVWSAGF